MTRGRDRRFVLLHGLAGSVAMWQPVADLLAPRGEVSVPELPWSGTATSEWGHHRGQSGLLGEQFGPGDVVVAHSYAATLLLGRLVRKEPPTPAAVVLVSPFFRPRPSDFQWSTITHFLGDFHLLLAEGMRAATGRPIPDERLHDMAVSVRDRIGPYGWIRFFETYLASATWDVRGVSAPVCVVHGDDDSIAPPQDAVDLYSRLPRATLRIVPGAGHFPMLLDAPNLADAILRTAARRPATPAAGLPGTPHDLRPHRPSQEVPA